MLQDIWRVRGLLHTLVRRDLLVRYQSSVLGFLWSFAKPLALVAIFQFAFGTVIGIGSATSGVPLSLHLLVGILVWSFFARSVAEGHWAVLSHANLIRKVRLPVEVFPTTTVVGNLINFLLGMVVVFPIVLVLLARHGGPDITWGRLVVQLGGFALLTALLSLLTLALTLLVSAVNVYYRDVESVSEVLLQAWFYATPIVYPATLVERKFAEGGFSIWFERLYWLNPMTPICVAYRRLLLYTPSPATAAADAAAAASSVTSAAASVGTSPAASAVTSSALSGEALPLRQAFIPQGLEMADSLLAWRLAGAVVLTVVLFVFSVWVFRRLARSFADEV